MMELTSPKTPEPMPALKMFPISDAMPAITITVIACPNAAGSFSISVSVATSAFIAPTIRPVKSAMHPPRAILADEAGRPRLALAPVLRASMAGGNELMARKGDILGLGDAGLSSSPNDEIRNRESSWSDSSEEAKRRRRLNEGADELTPTSGSEHQGGHGAAGIDMGAGGEGTDLE